MAVRCKACNGLVTSYKLKLNGEEEDLCSSCLSSVEEAVNELDDDMEDYEGGYN